MKKQLLLALLLLGGPFIGHAQQPAASNPPAVAAPTLTRADTVAAIRNIYSRHRIGGYIWTGIGSAFTLRIATAAVGADNASGAVAGILIFGGVPAGIGIGKLTRFGKAEEAAVITAYEQSGRLPQGVKRRLKKKKYFAK